MTGTTATAPPRTFREALRLQRSVLTSAERRTLIWMAERLPPAVRSDHLTALALVAMAGAGVSYRLAGTHPIGLLLALVCLALNWFGDSLDGTLARVRRQTRPRYGYYVDHVLDVVGILFLMAGLGASAFMSAEVAVAVLLGYYLVSLEVFLATHSLGEFRMSFLGVGPTELRVLLAIGTVALVGDPAVSVLGHRYRLFDVGGTIAAIGLGATFVYSACRNTRALYLADPLPPDDRS